MRRFGSTFQFIHICREGREQRIKTLAKKLHIEEMSLDANKENIHQIMDFIKKIDKRCHDLEGDPPYTALGQTFHYSLSSDLRTLIILAITEQYFQMNIVLRHFIEFFIVSL